MHCTTPPVTGGEVLAHFVSKAANYFSGFMFAMLLVYSFLRLNDQRGSVTEGKNTVMASLLAKTVF